MNTPGQPYSLTPLGGLRSAPAAAAAASPAVSPALVSSAMRDVAIVGGGVILPALGVALSAGFAVTYAAMVLLWYVTGVLLVRHGLRSGTHPHARFGGANRVTLLRLALAGLLVGLLFEAAWAPPLAAEGRAGLAWGAVALATMTALLDAADGPLARRSGLASDFGARFDMETDAAFILVLCALVWQAGQTGPWVLAAGLLRYAFVAAAGLWSWLAAPLAPSLRRQTVCVIQITSLIICLAPIVPPPLTTALAAASLAMLSLSFAIDILTLAQARHPSLET